MNFTCFIELYTTSCSSEETEKGSFQTSGMTDKNQQAEGNK